MGKHKVPKIGDRFAVRPEGYVTVFDYEDASHILVVGDDGNSRIFSNFELRRKPWWLNSDGSLRKSKLVSPPPAKPKRVSRLDRYPVPKEHYVYMASIPGEVVYIGRGRGYRYLHCYSGRSDNRELNRLYFQKAPIIVEILAQGLSREASRELEAKLLRLHRPRCNQIIPSK